MRAASHWLAVGLLAVWPLRNAPAASMSLSVADVDADRRPTLRLSGLEPGRHGLQVSTNLRTWTTLVAGNVTNGEFRFQHADANRFATLFYRGIRLADSATPAVVAQVDSNAVAVAVITPEAGGSLSLTNLDGTQFSFSVGPSNVLEPVAITMRLVTNFSVFPAENTMRSAVAFSPDGFQFHGAGRLEIRYPTNVPSLKLSSYAFDGGGNGFHLVPDTVSSNLVRIAVTHFSGVGTGLWEPSERTRAATTAVEGVRDQMSHELGIILARERERALLGAEPQTDVGAEMTLRMQDYFDNQLKPYFAQAEKDCAMAQFLTREILGIERMSQLLGWENSPTSSWLGSTTFAKWNCNCLREAFEACEKGLISAKTLVQTVLSFERQAELLGSTDVLAQCGLGSFGSFLDLLQEQKLACATEWFGRVTYADAGSRTWDCSGGSATDTCTASSSAALSFEAEVERVELEDHSFPPFYYSQTWRLTLTADATGAFTHRQHSVHPYECGAVNTTTWMKNGASSGPMEIQVELTFEGSQLTHFTANENKSLSVKTAVQGSSHTTPCRPGDTGSSSSSQSEENIYLDPESVLLRDLTFTKRSALEIEATAKGTRVGVDGIKMPFSWTFSLRRKR